MIPTEPFSVHNERSGHVHRLALSGELDLATVPLLEAEFDSARLGEAELIIVDLTGVTFIDSTGINALLRMSDVNDASEGGRLRLVVGSRRVDAVLELAGVRDSLPIVSAQDVPALGA